MASDMSDTATLPQVWPQHGKTRIAYVHSKWQYCIPSEDGHTFVFVPCELDLLTPKINAFPGVIAEHFHVKSRGASYNVF